jgi:hypothetical protein
MFSLKDKGQALITFILTFIITIALLFFIVFVALGFLVTNYMQYACFMASRANLTGGERAARATLSRMIGDEGKCKLGFLASIEEIKIIKSKDELVGIFDENGLDGQKAAGVLGDLQRPGQAINRKCEGVAIKFTIPFYVPFLNLAQLNKVSNQSKTVLVDKHLNLTVLSVLGREPLNWGDYNDYNRESGINIPVLDNDLAPQTNIEF